ncbi:Serine-threonine/tyrosine-protein kinase, catalytic domain [Dillenia turbinata]|uniref:Serine-threonine/tyrosine-protein kinase, catalytic domain n=1 Tax=Dillenia turbinata TaxID=194707 RepID=A0AAN8YV40_9MAGN
MTDTPSADGSKRRWPQMVGLSVLACALGLESLKRERALEGFSCATKNFSEKEKFGEEGFGAAFKSLLKDSNVYVAVKRVSRGSKQGIKEIASEVKIISHLRSNNLVQFLGAMRRENDCSYI